MAHTRPHQDDDNDDDIFFLLNGIHKKTTHQNKNDVSTKSNTAGTHILFLFSVFTALH